MIKKVTDYTNPSLEELMKITEPVRVYTYTVKGSDKPRTTSLFPFNEVKRELIRWLPIYQVEVEKRKVKGLNPGQRVLNNINQMMLKDMNPSLFNKLVSWSYMINGTASPKRAIQEMGLNTLNERQTLDEYKANILQLFPEEFIISFLNNGMTKIQRVDYVKNAPRNLKSAYEARKWRTKEYNLSIVDIIDNTYPNIVKQTGLLPSQILWFTPFSENNISELINKMYYDGEDIRSQALEQTPQGKKLLYFIRFTENRPNIPMGQRRTRANKDMNVKAVKGGHSQEVLKYFRHRIFKDQRVLEYYLLNDVGSRGSLAFLSEIQFSLFINILAKYDQNLELFPELSGKINTPIEYVFDPSISSTRRIMHEKLRSADGRFNAGGKSYLVELKNTEYAVPKQFYMSLAKYSNITNWFDGKDIDEKVLLIDKSINGNARKIPEQWKVIRGDEFNTLYRRALELWYSREPELENYSPLTTLENMLKMHDLLHDKSHLLVRKGNRALRNIIEFTEMKLFHHLNSPSGLFNNYRTYKDTYSVNLDALGVYPQGYIEHIPEKTLFLDLETTGFRNSGIQVIMATVGERIGSEFRTDLYFARTPFEEKLLLERVISRIEASSEIVTYNGSSFDVPLIEERSFVNMIKYLCNKKHTDLYKGYYKDVSINEKFPRSKLKTFERIELKLDRRGDVNGSAIPEIYKNHLLGEDDDSMMHVISHNFLDVFTMPFVYLHSQGHRFDTEPVEVNLQNFNGLFKH